MSLWNFLDTYGVLILSGTWVTIMQFLLATAVAVAVALAAGLGKLSRNWLIRGVAVTYI